MEAIQIQILGSADAAILDNVAAGVFDYAIHPRWTAEFLADTRHHLVVAVHQQQVVGMASGFHYVHPDKPPELFVNEIGVAPDYQNQGIGRRLLKALFTHAKNLGCREAWLGTEKTNMPARRLYQAAGGQEESEHTVIVWFDLNSEV